jgi:hypothetical protein
VVECIESIKDGVNQLVDSSLEEAYERYIKRVPFKAVGGIQYVWKH